MSTERRLKVYIACGLTHVPRDRFGEYVRFVHELARALESTNALEVSYALRDSDPQLAHKPLEERARLCYLWDREMVEASDVVIGDATYPSIGLGIELQIADSRGIPIILSFERSESHRAVPIEYETPDMRHHQLQIGEGFVSLMALGLPSLLQVIPYSEPERGVRALVEAVKRLRRT